MNKQYIISKNLPNAVPDKIWENIFSVKNADFFVDCLFVMNYRTVLRFHAMKDIANISLVCKKFNCIARKLLPLYVDEIAKDMYYPGEKVRFIHRVLGMPPIDTVRFNIVDNLPYAIPGELWGEVFLMQNEDFAINSQMSIMRQTGLQWSAMKNIAKLSLVCKRFNIIARTFLIPYVNEIKTNIDSLGGKDYVLYESIMHFDNLGGVRHKLIDICMAMKADLNSTKYTEMKGETLLTQAIKKNPDQILYLLQQGVDVNQPNQQGEMPIDLAYQEDLKYEVKWIKSRGGDPNNKYYCSIDDDFMCKQGQFGYACSGMPTAQQTNLNIPNFAVMNQIPSQTSITGFYWKISCACVSIVCVAGAVAYWLSHRSSKTTNNKEDNNLDVDVESREESHDSVEAISEIDGSVKELVS